MPNIPIKTVAEIAAMREGGKILAEVLEELTKRAKAGISTYELDQFAENFIKEHGGLPSFKGYHGFPGTLCTCRNEVIVHGIPRKEDILQEGDLFTIDCGVLYKGLNTDAARTVGIGEISSEKKQLMETAYTILGKVTDMIRPGLHVNEIGKTVEEMVNKAGFYVVRDLTGHGVGVKLHEPPIVLNYYDGTPGPVIKAGMTLAIEPIFAIGTGQMITQNDGWTIVTKDRQSAVQVENTILVTENGAEVLTEIF